MAPSDYVWIRTRDGSPTLWNESLGESFRSLKGAFTESWAAFVGPALESARRAASPQKWIVGEFGLGPGTNWALWTLASTALGLESQYFAIERDASSFELGRARWIQIAPAMASFLASRDLAVDEAFVRTTLEQAPSPLVIAALEAAPSDDLKADLWFHDPFGFEVNPEGFTPQTLALCQALWSPSAAGFSYACNRRFQEALETLPGVSVEVVPTGGAGLKRERLEFRRGPVSAG